jgi:hypothetical protein
MVSYSTEEMKMIRAKVSLDRARCLTYLEENSRSLVGSQVVWMLQYLQLSAVLVTGDGTNSPCLSVLDCQTDPERVFVIEILHCLQVGGYLERLAPRLQHPHRLL